MDQILEQTPSTEELWLPKKGDYIHRDIIGSPLALGGESDVFHLKRQNSEDCVIKIYRDGWTPEAAEKIDRLTHPHLLKTLETGVHGKRFYEITPYLSHGNAKNLKPNQETEIRALVGQINEALQHLHLNGYLHRDIKPENILIQSLEPKPHFVLSDFGQASRKGADQTALTLSVATLGHTAPEAATGLVSKASDYWSLGSSVLELLTGKKANLGKTPKEQYFSAVEGKIHIDPQLPNHWKVLLYGLTHKNHQKRWGYEEVKAWTKKNPSELPKARPPIEIPKWLPKAAIIAVALVALPFVGKVGYVYVSNTEFQLKKASAAQALQEQTQKTEEAIRTGQQIAQNTNVDWDKLSADLTPQYPALTKDIAAAKTRFNEAKAQTLATYEKINTYLKSQGGSPTDNYTTMLLQKANQTWETAAQTLKTLDSQIAAAKAPLPSQSASNPQPLPQEEPTEITPKYLEEANTQAKAVDIQTIQAKINSLPQGQQKQAAQGKLNRIVRVFHTAYSLDRSGDSDQSKAYQEEATQYASELLKSLNP
jgi:serine/threonine protein kinase